MLEQVSEREVGARSPTKARENPRRKAGLLYEPGISSAVAEKDPQQGVGCCDCGGEGKPARQQQRQQAGCMMMFHWGCYSLWQRVAVGVFLRSFALRAP